MKSKIVLQPVSTILFCCVLLVMGQYGAIAKENTAPQFSKKQASFVENKGQVRDQFGNKRNDIDYMMRGKGFTLFVANGELHYQFAKMQQDPNKVDIFKLPSTTGEEKIDAYRLDVKLLNANVQSQLVTEQPSAYYERYYTAGMGKSGTVAHACGKLIYKNIYPSIDWVIYVSEDNAAVKYDFVVHNGGNPAAIQLRYDGATSLTLQNGALEAVTPLGNVHEEKPYSYDAVTKQEISSSYTLAGNVLSFNVAQHSGDIVIDPSIHWSTYFGDNGLEYAYSTSADNKGRAYLAGHTTSASGIATTGAFSTTYQGNKDGFLARYDGEGILLWATYYGNTASDNFFYVSADTLGSVYASGITASTSGIATTGSFQSTYGGGNSDAYLVKFDSFGARQWATYYGGSGDEAVPASFDDYMVATTWSRANNKVYLCGMTTSASNIATTNAQQATIGGNKDGYLVQFNSSGARQWATYFGGSGDDKIIKLASDDSGYVYAVGPTNSSSGIATSGVHQTSFGGGGDAFLAKYDDTGSLRWCTYMGGTANDDPAGVAVDNAGAVYIAGSTLSLNNIATSGSFQQIISAGGATDAYLVKFTPLGQRVWGTYFGGSGPDFTADIAIDKTGNICFSGFTGSSGIASGGAYQFTFGGNSDAFIAIFGPSGTRSWVSYLGGPNADNASAISYSRTGDLFIAGSTSSNMGVATTGAYQTNLNGLQDGYLAKFFADTSAYVLLTFSPLIYCAGDSMYVPYGVTNNFNTGNTFTVQLSDQVGSFNSPTNLSSVNATGPGVIGCKLPVTLSGVGYRIRLVYTSPAGVGYPNNYNINIKPLPQKPVITHNSPICSGKDLIFTGSSTTPNVTYLWYGPNNFSDTAQSQVIYTAQTNVSGLYVEEAILAGCIRRDSFTAVVDSTPVVPFPASNSPVCVGTPIFLTSYSPTAGVNYTWKGPLSYTSNMANPTILGATMAMAGTYVSTAHLGNCSTTDSIVVNILQTQTPSISLAVTPGVNICFGDQVTFTATVSGGGNAPQYLWYRNGSLITGVNTWYWTTTSINTGDVIHCVYVGDWPCLTKPADTSNKITMNASGNVPPAVSIKATPGLNVPSGTAITFIASHVNGGNFPRYIWYKNGTTLLQDSKNNVYIGIEGKNFKSGDKITCTMISDLVCANPDSAFSNEMIIGDNVVLAGINTLYGNHYRVYPNPATSELHIEGLAHGTAMQLCDVLGKVVMKSVAENNNEIMNISSLSNGAYVLQLIDKDGNRTNVKVVKQ